MPRWNKVQIVTDTGGLYYGPAALAASLVEAGLATVESERPLIVQLISIKRVGSARIPDDCKNFIEEYVATSGYRFYSNHRTRRPRGAVEHVHLEDGYVRLPIGF